MKKFKLLFGTIAIFGGLFLFSGQTTQASTTHWDRAPKVLKGNWITGYHKTPRKYSSSRNRYYYTSLNVTNKQFHIEDFMLNKYKHSEYNSGPYGAFSNVYSLGFQKVTSRRYYVWGSASSWDNTNYVNGYGIVLSHSHKHLKLYSFHVKATHDSVHFSHRHYVGYFHRGIH